MIHKQRIDRFKKTYKEKLNYYTSIKNISEKDSDFGDIEGIQFDSEQKGGFIYFWSSGYINFHLYDYILDEEIVKDTLIEVDKNGALQDILSDFISKL
jgi:hypothetical protein